MILTDQTPEPIVLIKHWMKSMSSRMQKPSIYYSANQQRITRISTNWSELKDCRNNVGIQNIYIYSLVGFYVLGHGSEVENLKM